MNREDREKRDAILLLTVSLGRADSATAKPLSVKEWSQLARWLDSKQLQPQDLLNNGLESLMNGWSPKTIGRMKRLLGRGVPLSLQLEKWERAGLWVLTLADAAYPPRLKDLLGKDSPPSLFVCGDASLLNRDGIAIVGSRNAAEDELAYTRVFAARVAGQGLAVVSGGARGVDQSAMLGALEHGGTATGVLANGLLGAATSRKYREYIIEGNLALISPFNPEVSFNVGFAMARNRYIYCLSRAAVVIRSELKQGGTWQGAVENLEAGWVPLWIKSDLWDSGNRELAGSGGRWLRKSTGDLTCLYENLLPNEEFNEEEELYRWFLRRLKRMTADQQLSNVEIVRGIGIKQQKINDFLKRGVGEQCIERETKPVRYRIARDKPRLL